MKGDVWMHIRQGEKRFRPFAINEWLAPVPNNCWKLLHGSKINSFPTKISPMWFSNLPTPLMAQHCVWNQGDRTGIFGCGGWNSGYWCYKSGNTWHRSQPTLVGIIVSGVLLSLPRINRMNYTWDDNFEHPSTLVHSTEWVWVEFRCAHPLISLLCNSRRLSNTYPFKWCVPSVFAIFSRVWVHRLWAHVHPVSGKISVQENQFGLWQDIGTQTYCSWL